MHIRGGSSIDPIERKQQQRDIGFRVIYAHLNCMHTRSLLFRGSRRCCSGSGKVRGGGGGGFLRGDSDGEFRGEEMPASR